VNNFLVDKLQNHSIKADVQKQFSSYLMLALKGSYIIPFCKNMF